MKNWRRIFALLLVTVLAFTALAGCSGEEEVDLTDEVETLESTVTSAGGSADDIGKGGITSSVNTTEWGKVEIKDNVVISDDAVLKKNLKGAQIILYGMTKPDSSKSKADAAHAKVFEDIEKKLNCKIKYVDSTHDKTKQQAILNVMSSTHFADVIATIQHQVVGYLTSDLLLDLSKFKGSVDLSQAYMNVGAGVEAFHLGSGYWAVNQPLGLAGSGSYMYYNKRIMKEVTGDANHPYKLMSQNKWNITSWRELNKKATKELNGDGKMTDADQWGLVQCDIGTAGMSSMLQANRALMIKNVNGMLAYNMEDGKCIPAIQLAVDTYYRDNACINTDDAGAIKIFTSGHALFYGGSYANTCKAVADMKDDFGILPYPMGDGQKEYSVCTNWNCGVFAIPASVPKDKKSNAGSFLQAYMLLADRDAVPALFDEYQLRYCRDNESKENLMIGYKAQYTTPCAAVANDEAIKMGTYRVCYDAANKAPATTVAANKGISIKAIADLNDKLK